MNHKIDAKGKKLGRVASEAAQFLMGKNSPEYKRNVAPDVSVEIVNASQLDINSKKADGKVHTRYSGYPGGLKKQTLTEMVEKHGYARAVKSAVRGMLPKNKLQSVMMNNLKVHE